MSEQESQPVFAAGDVIDGRYRMVRRVGVGGMAEVYEAVGLESNDRVAIKTVRPDLLGNAKVITRFTREFELSRRISHSGVLKIFEVVETRRPGASEDARLVPCMVMEFLAGETLADRMVAGRLVDPDEAIPLTCQMASALTAAHRAGVVHRDLKPDNIFLTLDGETPRVVLTDFGVARRDTKQPKDDSLTASNVILGTPDYMAPEQLELEIASPASDIYAMGLVIFEMILGERPFVADSMIKMVFKRVQEDPPSPLEYRKDLDPKWETVILRCLARKPEDRYPEAQDLIRVLDGDGSEWLLPTRAERLKKWWLLALIMVLAAAALAASLWWG